MARNLLNKPVMLRHTALLCLVLGACAARPQAPSTPRIYYCGTSRVTEHTDAIALASTERHDVADAGAEIGSQTCSAADPYDAVLIRYLRSHDLHAVATELHVTDEQAKLLVGEAMHQVHLRFWKR